MVTVDEAFNRVDRRQFVPERLRAYADYDQPLAIGYGQTISQPTTVHRMLLWLDAQRGHRVLDVGSGSGWTTALLSVIVGERGKVYAVERIPELLERGRDNCERAGVTNAEFCAAGDDLGLPEYAPYDRILVSASADELPKELCDQLTEDGKMVVPVHETIMEVDKLKNGVVEVIRHPGYVFVPLL